MPSSWRWCTGQTTMPARRVVHAMLASWLDDDHHAERKPWSWAGRCDGGQYVIDIGLVDDSLIDRLTNGADIYRRSPTSRIPMASAVTQTAASTWHQLAVAAPRTDWTLEFVSPVTFRRGSRFMPWPAPSSVFGSLRSSWRLFGAPHVGDLTLDLKLDPIVVGAIDGHSETERVLLRGRTEGGRAWAEITVTGFTGRIRYVVDGAVDPSAVSSLVALAPYAGLGAYTTRGFGGVRQMRGRG